MIAFLLTAVAMIAVALAFVLYPLLRRRHHRDINREASNVAILREQMREIETDVANGTLPAERLDQARREIEQRVLEESQAAVAPVARAGRSRAGAWSAITIGALLPVFAVVFYVLLGNPEAFVPQAMNVAQKGQGTHDLAPGQVDEMITKLTAKLEKEPTNADGWIVLARTYYVMKRFPEAAKAFEKAVALAPDVPDLLADYADTLGAALGGSLQGKPLELIERALKADPTHWKALALAGTAAFDRKDYRAAVGYWERLKPTVPPESDIARSIDASIGEARQLGGLPPASPAASTPRALPSANLAAAAPSAPTAAPATAPAMPGTTVSGKVSLAPALAAKASPEDAVFVFARAAQGSKMPLAIMKYQVKDLPLSFTLDDSMAMSPAMKLSSTPEIVVGARISKSGNAMPSSGDLEGLSAPIKPGSSGIAVVVDTTLP